MPFTSLTFKSLLIFLLSSCFYPDPFRAKKCFCILNIAPRWAFWSLAQITDASRRKYAKKNVEIKSCRNDQHYKKASIILCFWTDGRGGRQPGVLFMSVCAERLCGAKKQRLKLGQSEWNNVGTAGWSGEHGTRTHIDITS
jgi:hypothetical protein